MIHKKWP